jgi:2,5-diketo-D-gluconate reductase A
MSDVATTTTLNNNVRIPQLGFGTFQVPPRDTERVVSIALEAGYRSIDTAAAYHNEKGVGKAIASSGVPREEIFVTTKLWNADHGYDQALRAFDASARRLGLDIVDLYLIHWPVPSADRYVETWKALEKLAADGRVRAIGVSNFAAEHLRRLLAETGTVPADGATRGARRAWHHHRSVEPAGPRHGAVRPHHHPACRPLRRNPGSAGVALALAAGQHRDP